VGTEALFLGVKRPGREVNHSPPSRMVELHISFWRLLTKNIKINIYKTIIVPVILYRRETWSLTLREENRRRVSENRVLRIFIPKREEVMGGRRKLHNEELHNLYSSPSIIRMIKLRRMGRAGHVTRTGKRNAYRIWVGKPEGKRPLG
jgi:hypothetical protein